MSLSALLHGVATVSEDVMLSGISIDSRKLAPGGLFLACRGHAVHGASFARQAVQAGAAAVVFDPDDAPSLDGLAVPAVAVPGLADRLGHIASAFYRAPSSELDVIGVTGTNGKTTVTLLLAHALNSLAGRDSACGVIGTLGHGFAAAKSEALNTTPDAVQVQSLLAWFRQRQAQYAVLEASSHALAQQRLAGVRFKVAVLTQVGRDHLDYHASVEEYAACKQRLFAWPELQVAVLNIDDHYGRQWLQHSSAKDLRRYSMRGTGDSDVYTCRVRGFDQGGSAMQISYGGNTVDCSTRLVGRCNAAHVLATVATLHALAVPLPEAAAAVATAPPVPGRMEAFSAPGKPVVVVDYAHNPGALMAVLQDLRQLTTGRLWCVFGCGGERDQGKRPIMGGIAARLADEVVVTSDNPRNEKAAAICGDILSGMPPGGQVRQIVDRSEAVAFAIGAAKFGDVVLVAGKGHETVQEVGGRKLAYADAALVRQLLAAAD